MHRVRREREHGDLHCGGQLRDRRQPGLATPATRPPRKSPRPPPSTGRPCSSIQPRRERSPVVITSRSSGSSRKGGRGRAARWRRLAAWRSRWAPSGWYQVRRSRRRVDRGAGRPGRAWEEVRGGVVDVVGDETGAACGRGPAARFSSRNGTRRWCRPRLGRIRAQGARRARRLAQGRSV